jgi:hypothetical protein
MRWQPGIQAKNRQPPRSEMRWRQSRVTGSRFPPPLDGYTRLRQWFSERDWEKWDRQFEADSEAGKLDFLLQEARDV